MVGSISSPCRFKLSRAEGGVEYQLDEADSLEQESQRMTILGPLIIDIHTASLGNIKILVLLQSPRKEL